MNIVLGDTLNSMFTPMRKEVLQFSLTYGWKVHILSKDFLKKKKEKSFLAWFRTFKNRYTIESWCIAGQKCWIEFRFWYYGFKMPMTSSFNQCNSWWEEHSLSQKNHCAFNIFPLSEIFIPLIIFHLDSAARYTIPNLTSVLALK